MKYIILILLAVTFSACINVEIQQQLNEDGSSYVQITQDLSAIIEMANSMGNGSAEINNNLTDQMSGFCNNATRLSNLKNIQCESNEYVVTLKGDLPSNSVLFKKTGGLFKTTYTYEVRGALNSLSQDSEAEQNALDFRDEQLRQSKQAATMMGLEYNYVLQMPAIIKSADVGDVEGNTVIINIFDLIGKEQVFVTAEKSNSGVMIGLIIFALLIIGLIIVLLIKKKSASLQNQKVDSSQQIQHENLQQSQQAQQQNNADKSGTQGMQ